MYCCRAVGFLETDQLDPQTSKSTGDSSIYINVYNKYSFSAVCPSLDWWFYSSFIFFVFLSFKWLFILMLPLIFFCFESLIYFKTLYFVTESRGWARMVWIPCRHGILTMVACLYPSFWYKTKMAQSWQRTARILKYWICPTPRFNRHTWRNTKPMIVYVSPRSSFSYCLLLSMLPHLFLPSNNTNKKKKLSFINTINKWQ